jgi:hypothetical protein
VFKWIYSKFGILLRFFDLVFAIFYLISLRGMKTNSKKLGTLSSISWNIQVQVFKVFQVFIITSNIQTNLRTTDILYSQRQLVPQTNSPNQHREAPGLTGKNNITV